MTDLISRQKALEAIDKYFDDLPIQGYYDMVQIITNLPPIEPRRGKWIFRSIESPYRWECNKCGDKVRARYNFCPNCGARMERSEDA